MRLKFALHRNAGDQVDIVVTTDATASVADVAAELVETDPMRRSVGVGENLTLSVAAPGVDVFAPLDPDAAIGDVALTSGFDVRVLPRTSARPVGERSGARVEVVLDSGPGAGTRTVLGPGAHVLGRGTSSDVVINDAMVSKSHARLQVGEIVELVDLNSANGLLVDGGLVARLTISNEQVVVLGDTAVRFLVSGGTEAVASRIVAGVVPHNRSPRVEDRYPGTEYAAPDVPNAVDPPVFPWLMMMVPALMGAVMFAATKSALSLVFVAMSPMMMLGNYFMSRQRNSRRLAAEVARFEEQMTELDELLCRQVPVERSVRDRETPTSEVLRVAAIGGGDLLWTRRPEHWSFLHLRLGTGTALSRNAVGDQAQGGRGIPEYAVKLDELIERFRYIEDVPVVEDLQTCGSLGVVASNGSSYEVARSLLVQLCSLHAPTELVLTAMTGAQGAEEFEWLKWLPHTSSAHSPFAGTHLAESVASATALLGQLEGLIAERTAAGDVGDHRPPLGSEIRATAAGARVGDPDDGWAPPPLPVVVVLISHEVAVDRGRLVQFIERAPAAGIFPIFVGEAVQDLPAACRTWVDTSAGPTNATLGFVRHGVKQSGVRVESTSRVQAMDFARRLSGVVDAGAFVADASDLPRTVSILSLLGDEMAASSAAVVDRWRQNDSLVRYAPPPKSRKRPPTLRALVGQVGVDSMHLDLRSQGPHALVGGTTGSGKSEFLQSWVLGMAAEYSPQRVTFLFVDYKGGAAFADCVDLPHCVGLVTDLSPHLVIRALESLRAELRHREHVLNRKKAKDLLELEKRRDPECPPALILVIDEFAALVGEVPEFVDGVVDIAQRGRSLGIHLIMATQRPAGVIRDNLRANTNLRIALRMADESDSQDVVGSSVAAGFDPTVPGRAMAKTGPGRLTQFQSAYAGGWSDRTEPQARSVVQELRFGAEVTWERPEDDAAVEPDDPGPTDQARLVATIRSASVEARLEPPRRPWLPDLERTYDLKNLGPNTDAALVLGMGDLPAEQAQSPMYFRPDEDGHLAVYGTGGSGKSGVLRTLAAGAGITPNGGPVEVFGLDFSSGGLRMLDVLPHVAAVVPGEDGERVVRVLRRLKNELDRRGRDYPQVDASSIVEYRAITGRRTEPRILLLIDGFPSFRSEYEGVPGRSQWYGVFQQILTEGRGLGMHVVLTADRSASVPGAVSSSIPRRVVLRLAEETMYTMLDVPADVLGPTSPPGRAVVDQVETQIAVLGGSGVAAEQAAKLAALAADMRALGRVEAAPVLALATEYPISDLPDNVAGRPALGVSEESLEAVGFEAGGAFLLGGGPGSGRSNALRALVAAVDRARPTARRYYFGGRRSPLADQVRWDGCAVGAEESAALARELTAELLTVDPVDQLFCVVIEALSDFQSSPADAPLVELIKAAKRTGHLVIAESETSTWSSSWPLFGEIKSARRGLLLQPDQLEGELLLKTTFPRGSRAEFPPGRGYFVESGKVHRVQLPLA